MTLLNNIAVLAFSTMMVSLLAFVILYRMHKAAAEFAFLVMSAALGILILFAVWSMYAEGGIESVPGAKFFKRSVARENEPVLFHAILGAFAVVGLALSAIVPVGMWRIARILWSRRRPTGWSGGSTRQ